MQNKVGPDGRDCAKLAWQTAPPADSALPVALIAQPHFRSNHPLPSTVTKEKNPVWYAILGPENHLKGVVLHLKRSTNKWNKKLNDHCATGESTVANNLASIWRDTEQHGQNEVCLRGAKLMSWSDEYLKNECTQSYAGIMAPACFYFSPTPKTRLSLHPSVWHKTKATLV